MIPSWTSNFIGLEFSSHGRGPTSFDCWGFCVHIFQKQFGIELPKFNELYADEAEIKSALAIAQDEQSPWTEVELSEIQEGDIVLFASVREVLHTAIVLDRKNFIHCNSHTIYSAIEQIDAPQWRDRIIAIYRHKELQTWSN